MSTLSELYITMESLRKLNLPIDEKLKQEAAKLEEDLIRTEILPTLTDKIEPALAQVQRELVLVVDYVPGEPLKVSLSRKRNITDVLTDAVEITSTKRPHIVTATDIKRGPNIDFTVTFADGTKYAGKGKDVLVDSLRHMSLPRVAPFKGRTFAGFPLVGRQRRVTEDGYKWQEQVDGWWVYINMGNPTKMEVLRKVAKHLGIEITIDSEDTIPSTEENPKAKTKRPLFSLNGSQPYNKRNLVYAVNEKFMELHPDATFEDVVSFFPKNLQGGYGVVASEEEYNARIARGQDADKRYFVDKPIFASGTRFYVCHQWGDNFDNFRNHVTKEFGWTIKEV